MTKKRLALTKDGKLTYCSAKEENVGKYRCNHQTHQNQNESSEKFMKRIQGNLTTNNDLNTSNKDCKVDKDSSNQDFDREIKYSKAPKELSFDKSKKEFLEIQEKEHPMAGAQDKFYYDNRIYKLDNENDFMGKQHNALSEEMSTIVESCIENFNYVGYSTTKIKWKDQEKIATSSLNFKRDNESFMDLRLFIGDKKADDLIEDDFDYIGMNRQHQLDKFCSVMDDLEVENSKEELLKIISLDLLILNGDRALNNIGILKDKVTGEKYFAPCFDNGDALLSSEDYDNYTSEDFDCIDEEVNICTFGIGSNDDYVNLIKDNGGPLLEISKDKLLKKLDSYSNDFYENKLIERNKQLIKHRLDKFKGILYKNIDKEK